MVVYEYKIKQVTQKYAIWGIITYDSDFFSNRKQLNNYVVIKEKIGEKRKQIVHETGHLYGEHSTFSESDYNAIHAELQRILQEPYVVNQTDIYQNELNYCYLHKYNLYADSAKQAIRTIMLMQGFSGRYSAFSIGYKPRGYATCFYVDCD